MPHEDQKLALPLEQGQGWGRSSYLSFLVNYIYFQNCETGKTGMRGVNGTLKVILNIVTFPSEYSGLTRAALDTNLKTSVLSKREKRYG